MQSAEGLQSGEHEQITRLKELLSVSAELREMEKTLRKYPEELSVFKGEIQSTQETLAEKTLAAEEADKSKSALEQELADKKIYIQKAEGRLLNIKTHREYEALQKELTEAKRQCIEIEDKTLALMETLETLKMDRAELKRDLEEKTEKYAPKMEALERTMNELENKAAPYRERRDSIVGGLTPEVRLIYTKISRKTHDFLAVARGEMCTNCNMNIPPQMFNDVLTGARVIQCPSCAKILHSGEDAG